MRIITYKTILDEDKKPILVKESSRNYSAAKVLGDSKTTFDMLNAMFDAKNLTDEHAWAIAVNSKLAPIGIVEVSHGSTNSAFISAQSVFTKMCLLGASGCIFSHNHPSGDTSPSQEDCNITDVLNKAGDLLGIKLLDHIIIGDSCFSFREKALILD